MNVVIVVNAGEKDHVHVIKKKIPTVDAVLIVHVKTMVTKVNVVARNEYY